MDQVAPGFADADIGLGLAPGHSELGLVARAHWRMYSLTDLPQACAFAWMVICSCWVARNPILQVVDLEIVGIKIFLLHN